MEEEEESDSFSEYLLFKQQRSKRHVNRSRDGLSKEEEEKVDVPVLSSGGNKSSSENVCICTIKLLSANDDEETRNRIVSKAMKERLIVEDFADGGDGGGGRVFVGVDETQWKSLCENRSLLLNLDDHIEWVDIPFCGRIYKSSSDPNEQLEDAREKVDFVLWTLNRSASWNQERLASALGPLVRRGDRRPFNLPEPEEGPNAGHWSGLQYEGTDKDEYFVPIVVKCLGNPMRIRRLITDQSALKRLDDLMKAYDMFYADPRSSSYWSKYWEDMEILKKGLGMKTKNMMGYYEIMRSCCQTQKTVLVGYSQGGLVARFLAWMDENLFFDQRIVAGVITVQSPNFGSPLGDCSNGPNVMRGILAALSGVMGFDTKKYTLLLGRLGKMAGLEEPNDSNKWEEWLGRAISLLEATPQQKALRLPKQDFLFTQAEKTHPDLLNLLRRNKDELHRTNQFLNEEVVRSFWRSSFYLVSENALGVSELCEILQAIFEDEKSMQNNNPLNPSDFAMTARKWLSGMVPMNFYTAFADINTSEFERPNTVLSLLRPGLDDTFEGAIIGTDNRLSNMILSFLDGHCFYKLIAKIVLKSQRERVESAEAAYSKGLDENDGVYVLTGEAKALSILYNDGISFPDMNGKSVTIQGGAHDFVIPSVFQRIESNQPKFLGMLVNPLGTHLSGALENDKGSDVKFVIKMLQRLRQKFMEIQ